MNPWVILAFILAASAAAGGAYYKGNQAGQDEVRAEWNLEKLKLQDDYIKAQNEARKKEQEMQAAADKLRREKDAEIKNINARAIALSNSLHNRQARPNETSQMSDTANSGSGAAGCTGAGLYKSDGEFLVREATAGRLCQAYLRECRAKYDAAEKTLNKE